MNRQEAIQIVRSNWPEGRHMLSEALETLIPELRESEDERVRKELIKRLKWELQGAECQDAAGCNRQKDIEMFERGIAWLEKQGEHSQCQAEQKPAEWSGEDKKHLEQAIYVCHQHGYTGVESWLKSLRPQLKQEWSTEVDLEKEIALEIDNLCELDGYMESLLNASDRFEGSAKPYPEEVNKELVAFARHFYSLGLNAKPKKG